MAAVPLRGVSQRKGYEAEREGFEKTQTASIQKAVNAQEVPVKEKHARNTILGSFHEHGAGMFWSVALRLPLQANPIVAWKFCHIFHKLLRDGHPNVMIDSQKYVSQLTELGKLWGHLREGYGKLILSYTKLLVQKLQFHKKYLSIPGNLNLTNDQLEDIAGRDVNGYFEISANMFDYMDEILELSKAVFNSMDMSRSNSMTSSGQCKLAPLVQCILDSAALYDYLVKLLFKLHSAVPSDTLSGHRNRFLKEFKLLKQFYRSSKNLQYFKTLIQVPELPENPPNFLISSGIDSHVTPTVVIPADVEAEIPEVETSSLVDTTDQAPPLPERRFDEAFGSGDVGEFSFRNGAHSPPKPDEKDLLIKQLMDEIERLKQEIRFIKSKAEEALMKLKDRISDLEDEKADLQRLLEETRQERDGFHEQIVVLESNAAAQEKLEETEKHAKTADEKFKKMKDIYQKLREEHVTLLRKQGELNKQIAADKRLADQKEETTKGLEIQLVELRSEKLLLSETMQKSADETGTQINSVLAEKSQLEIQKQELEDKVTSLDGQRSTLEDVVKQLTANVSELQSQLDSSMSTSTHQLTSLNAEKADIYQQKQELESRLSALSGDKSELEATIRALQADLKGIQDKLEKALNDRLTTEQSLRQEVSDLTGQMLACALEEGEQIIQDSMDQFDNPIHATVTCTAEYFLSRLEPLATVVGDLQASACSYPTDKTVLTKLIKNITQFSHGLGENIIQGKATSNTAPIDQGDDLSNACRTSGEQGLQILEHIKQGASDRVPSAISDLQVTLTHIKALAEALVPKMEDVKVGEIGDLIDQEMHATSKAIDEAAKKIQEMLENSREKHTGIKLEVNERVLDSCTDLMMAIKILIEKSKSLQREIVASGRGASSEKEFYKKHHRWTEGLISAAKAVGWGANVLVEGADKVLRGEGKFEELVVCSQEIAASTAQLVVSSKVKAERGSEAMNALSAASKKVSAATGNVVASAKTGASMIEEQDTLNFSKITLHQAKRLEMNSQVRVLELESDLEKERIRLSELRKKHYQLAAESEAVHEAAES